jgi:hypothetical protein
VINFYQRDSKIFLRELDVAFQFPELSWKWQNDIPVLKGIYYFEKEYRGEKFNNIFKLEINFPPDYPEKSPSVKELENKIHPTFHRNPDSCLCLCTPAEQHLIFSREPTLENFMYNLLNPYLLSWLWYERFNEMPWGERKHGSLGLIESYQELLKLHNSQQVVLFIKKYIINRIDRNDNCPCGSGFSFKKCHRKIIINLENCLPKGQLTSDFDSILLGGFR